MKLKSLTFAVFAIVLAIPSLVHAQAAVSSTILPTLSANLTIGDEGKIKATITQNVTQPPASIGFSYLAFNSQSFFMTTANSTASSTVWRGKISLSSNGTFSGGASVDSYTANGTKSTAWITVNSTTSKIKSSSNNTTINRSNLRSESWGPYMDGNDYGVIAEYPVDVLINFSNGFTARGQIIQSLKITHNISNATEGEDYDDDDWIDYNLIMTGPGGQTGTYNQHFDGNL